MHEHIIQSRNKMMLPLNGKTISGALIFLILVSVCNSQPHYYEDDNTTKEPKVRTYHFFIRQFNVTKWVSQQYAIMVFGIEIFISSKSNTSQTIQKLPCPFKLV